jgi:DNA-directed RNA polymerase specialized sigma24 family protein
MFWTREAYEITKKLTGNSSLSHDLVSHVFLLLFDKDIPEDELPKTFNKFAYNQWHWPNSSFNREHRFRANTVDIIDDIDLTDDSNEYTEHEDFIYNYLHSNSATDEEMFIKEIASMHLCGMTYREIQSKTSISLDTINKTINQFKNDISNSFDKHRHCKSDVEL